ncbi:fibronectin type III domain-containing protein, partial [Aquimarina sediminis]|uniref:fibronectin type III domain-containing protein n=1 Tax=Aquimarina sediminis TaxID=2070536 RepID=UPI000CA05961
MKSRKDIFLLIPILLFSIFGNAQNRNDREHIKSQTNLQALQKIINRSNDQNKTYQTKAFNQNIPLTKTTADGRLGVLYSFNENGDPVYAYDDNVDAAATGRTDRIWTGGSSGLNLTGAGIQIGVWESGKASSTHQELVGRVTSGDAALPTNHGTHTGGTLIATGVDPAARGMASEATIKGYTASGMVAEAAAFAAAGGILANNSNSPNGPYGQYDTNARDMDEVAYNAPFYLHCKSAGNNGGQYGNIYGNQLAKNLFVVANSNDVLNYTGPSSVSMASSSTYGPPDDWRIKPDITNNGVGVYSSDAISDTSYSSKTGTSMSTPATAGTVALLQQHYKNNNGVYMKAATAKALIIDTADEVGANDGPDFRSGWGLVNAEKAAEVITNNGNTSVIDELTLNNGGTYTRTFTSNGSAPLALTIVWNDPAGPTNNGNNPVLVNDLDVRITGNGNTYSPWIMIPNANFNNYTDAAQKGDNFRDNVEKIDAVLAAGTYTVTVTHKGTLTNGSQDFSLIINGIVGVPDNQAPSTPTNLTASNIGATTADLSWTASTDNVGVTAYEIFQGATSIGTSTTTNYTVTGLTANTTYSFTVKAKDAAGNVSASSNTANVTTTDTPACTGITTFPYSESFESGFGAWTNASGDDIEWTRDSGGTPSNATGPSSGQDGAFYLYTEASTNVSPPGSPNKVALLNSPCIDLSSSSGISLEFGYHMQGTAMGTLEVLASTDNGVTYTSIWSKSGSQGSTWNQATVSLATYGGSVIKLQFKGTTGSGWSSDIAIDNIKIISTVADTQAPSVPTNVTASNIGATSADLTWTASTDNVGVTAYEIFQGATSIGTSTTTNYTVTGLTANTTYSFTVKAKDAAGNVSASSTAVSVTTTSTPGCTGITTFPYSESFESGFGAWTNASGDDIEWTRDSGGTPSNATGPSSGQDGAFYLYTEASTNVSPPGSPNKVALLNSPCIDLSSSSGISLEFGYHMQGTDMGTLEVLASTDNGVTYTSIWSKSGSQGSTWNQATVSLATYGGSVIKLQFKGTTGSGWSSDIAIDNIKIISTVADTQAPSVPTNVTASNIGATSVDLSWTASTDNVGVTAYEIFQGATSVGASTTANYTVTGLTANTTYSFTVKAKDAAGNVSTSSTAVNVTTTSTPGCTGITTFPYSESFESGFGAWINASGDDIEWTRDSGGTPSNGTGPTTGQDGAFYL